jgi:hypothetical protein
VSECVRKDEGLRRKVEAERGRERRKRETEREKEREPAQNVIELYLIC